MATAKDGASKGVPLSTFVFLNVSSVVVFALSAAKLLSLSSSRRYSMTAAEVLLPTLGCVSALTYMLGFMGVSVVMEMQASQAEVKAPEAGDKWAVTEGHRGRQAGSALGAALSLLVWPGIVWFPVYMTCFGGKELFGAEMWSYGYWREGMPSPLGLSLGIGAVVAGMVPLVVYHGLRLRGYLGPLVPIERRGAPVYSFWRGLAGHLSQPEGFLLLGLYLCGTWMFELMPESYYSREGGINWGHVALQLLVQDLIQYVLHYAEHRASKAFYRISHKPHHFYTNPTLFEAFSASPLDTTCMILLPLYLTANIVPANVWSYMTFGALYANWLTLIHSEFAHPWDLAFRALGLGTAADHHVHHKLFKFNFSHLFSYWDIAFGTYRDPAKVLPFNEGV